MPNPIEKYPDALESLEEGKERVAEKESPLSCFGSLEAGIKKIEVEKFPESVEIRQAVTLLKINANEYAGHILASAVGSADSRDADGVVILSILSEKERGGSREKAGKNLEMMEANLAALKKICEENDLDTSWMETFEDSEGNLDKRKASKWAMDIWEHRNEVLDKKEGREE